MTWYDAEYRRRQIVGIDATGGTGVSGTIDVEFQVPQDWDEFWDNIRSDFKDVVVTDSQGNLVDFARKAGSSYSTRTLTLQIDTLNIKNDDSFCVAYIYYFQPDETTDHSTSVTIDSPNNAYIMLSAPHSRVVSQPASQSALDAPVQSFIKASTDEVHVFFLINRNFAKRLSPYNERNDQEGIEYVDVKSYDSSGTDSSARYDIRATRIGNGFVRASFQAGDSGSDFAIAIQVYTTLGQLLEMRAILRVIDLLP
jgi:hypothetical protein